MILVNTDYITGKKLEMLGLAKGSTIQSKHLGKDITQGFKTLVGDRHEAYGGGSRGAGSRCNRQYQIRVLRCDAGRGGSHRLRDCSEVRGRRIEKRYGTDPKSLGGDIGSVFHVGIHACVNLSDF